jgi:hypothetical protein
VFSHLIFVLITFFGEISFFVALTRSTHSEVIELRVDVVEIHGKILNLNFFLHEHFVIDWRFPWNCDSLCWLNEDSTYLWGVMRKISWLNLPCSIFTFSFPAAMKVQDINKCGKRGFRKPTVWLEGWQLGIQSRSFTRKRWEVCYFLVKTERKFWEDYEQIEWRNLLLIHFEKRTRNELMHFVCILKRLIQISLIRVEMKLASIQFYDETSRWFNFD